MQQRLKYFRRASIEQPRLTHSFGPSTVSLAMKLLYLIISFLGFAFAQNSASNNNYLGSTPSERHVVNATQAASIIQAAAFESANISIPVNIAVTDPAGLVSFRALPSTSQLTRSARRLPQSRQRLSGLHRHRSEEGQDSRSIQRCFPDQWLIQQLAARCLAIWHRGD
jgi:hypothetical protein